MNRTTSGDAKGKAERQQTILRLIQVSFPALLDNVIDFVSPMEAAAKIAKEEYAQKHGVDKADVGVFFITPCAAKMTAVKSPVGQEKSHVDGVIAIKDVYAQMRAAMKQGFSPLEIDRASVVGIKWAIPGGEVEAVGIKSSLCVDGIDNVINVLEAIEDARFRNLTYFEGLACVNGCLGGPLTVENSFVAKNRLRSVMNRTLQKTVQRREIFEDAVQTLRMTRPIEPSDALQFSGTMKERIEREERIELLEQRIRDLGMNPEDYWWYCDLRRYGSCRHAGFGLGFERMVMYLTGIGNIRDVELHPRTVGNADF